jgi:hypothetical protein
MGAKTVINMNTTENSNEVKGMVSQNTTVTFGGAFYLG